MPNTITLKQLIKHGACKQQVELFKSTFGVEAVVTVEAAIKYASVFDFYWAAGNLLSDAGRAKYSADVAPIEEKYDADVASIEEKYNADVTPIWEKYTADVTPIWAKYRADRAPIDVKYNADRASIREKYNADMAVLFARIYLGE